MFAKIKNELKSRGEYRLGRYGTFLGRFAITRPEMCLKLCKFGDGYMSEGEYSLGIFFLWIKLWNSKTPPKAHMDSWGFSYEEKSLHLNWQDKYKIIHMPWMWDHCKTQVMLNDKSFVYFERFGKKYEFVREPENLFCIKLPYQYKLKSGIIQNRIATVKVERRQWCWRSWPFRQWRWPNKSVTAIDVEFDKEVGERAGTWKGGCVGCGYEMLPGETPEECLGRMENERKFN